MSWKLYTRNKSAPVRSISVKAESKFLKYSRPRWRSRLGSKGRKWSKSWLEDNLHMRRACRVIERVCKLVRPDTFEHQESLKGQRASGIGMARRSRITGFPLSNVVNAQRLFWSSPIPNVTIYRSKSLPCPRPWLRMVFTFVLIAQRHAEGERGQRRSLFIFRLHLAMATTNPMFFMIFSTTIYLHILSILSAIPYNAGQRVYPNVDLREDDKARLLT